MQSCLSQLGIEPQLKEVERPPLATLSNDSNRRQSGARRGRAVPVPEVPKGGRPTGVVDRRCRTRPSRVVGCHPAQTGGFSSELQCRGE